MARSFDEVMQDVSNYLSPELFLELNDVIVDEIAVCILNGNEELLNNTLDSEC